MLRLHSIPPFTSVVPCGVQLCVFLDDCHIYRKYHYVDMNYLYQYSSQAFFPRRSVPEAIRIFVEQPNSMSVATARMPCPRNN